MIYLFIFILYAIGLAGDFQFDDFAWIHDPLLCGELPHLHGRPIPSALLGWMSHIWGVNPMPYKMLGLILHLGVVHMLVNLCKRFEKGSFWVWIFAMHPVLVSTVAYPIQASVMMVTLACGWAFMCYDSKKYARCALLFIVACLCKQNAWVFPAVLISYEWVVKRKQSVVVPIAIGVIALNWYVFTHDIFDLYTNRLFSPWTRLTSEGVVGFKYLNMVLLPSVGKYTVCHNITVVNTPIFLIIWLLAITWGIVYGNRWTRFMILALIAMVAPECTFLNLELCFEHRLYLPLAIVAVSLPEPRHNRFHIPIIVWLMIVNLQYQWIWMSQERMWKHTVENHPSYRAHQNYAKVIYRDKPLLALYHFNEATKYIDKSSIRWYKQLQAVFKYWYAVEINKEVVKFDKSITP